MLFKKSSYLHMRMRFRYKGFLGPNTFDANRGKCPNMKGFFNYSTPWVTNITLIAIFDTNTTRNFNVNQDFRFQDVKIKRQILLITLFDWNIYSTVIWGSAILGTSRGLIYITAPTQLRKFLSFVVFRWRRANFIGYS